MSAVALRAMRDEDLAAMADLWVESWQATIPEIDFAARRAWLAGHLARLRETGAEVIVALAEDGIRGFVTIDPSTGYLDQIAVAEQAKGTGIAALLLAEARRRAPGGIELLVNEENPRALRFYEKEGFVAVERGVNEGGRATVRLRWTP